MTIQMPVNITIDEVKTGAKVVNLSQKIFLAQ